MAFRLTRHEKVGPGLVRLLAADLDAAHAELAAPTAEHIHKVRRRLKRDRSLLRVFAKAAPGTARAIRMRLRDAGRALAELRDGQVLAATAQRVATGLRGPAAAAVRAATTATAIGADHHHPVTIASRLVAEAREEVDRLPTGGGAAALSRALERAHDRSVRHYRRAAASRKTEDLHEWRTRLKDLVHLVRAAGSGVQDARGVEHWVRKAEQHLGDDHDLAILGDRVVAFARPGVGRAAGTNAIDLKRRELEDKALRLGRKIAARPAPRLKRR